MSETFTIEMLPGDYGDALWIEYGEAASPSRILIDGGATGSGVAVREKIETLPPADRKLELVVVTHIDLDHIQGVLEVIEQDLPEGLEIGEIWFNGRHTLPDPDGILGPKQGERLTHWIEKKGLQCNAAFGGAAAMLPDDLSDLPEIRLPGGMQLTLLSPTRKRLLQLLSEWDEVILGIGLEPGEAGAALAGHPEEPPDGVLGEVNVEALAASRFTKDDSRPNASSIAFLAEYGSKRVLFTGDAFADDLEAAIGKYLEASGGDRLKLDALKLSHHGGKKNTSPGLLRQLRCRDYLVPTSGARYHHPQEETISRILKARQGEGGARLYFNYRSDENEVWDDAGMREEWSYQTFYPPAGKPGLTYRIL